MFYGYCLCTGKKVTELQSWAIGWILKPLPFATKNSTMVRSPSKGRNDHDKSILTAQSDHYIDNKHQSTVESGIVTACSDVGGSAAAATDENEPET